jgi:hypothetical protein
LSDPWHYFCAKYSADKLAADEAQRELVRNVHCATGEELAKYLADPEIDRERSQSQPLRRLGDLEWCRRREDLDQQAIHEVLLTGLSKERGRGRGSLHGQSAVGIKNLHAIRTGKTPHLLRLVLASYVMLLTLL